MSTKSNEPKGFLGTDDLDLDAWDATFDALHVPEAVLEGAEGQGQYAEDDAAYDADGGTQASLQAAPEASGDDAEAADEFAADAADEFAAEVADEAQEADADAQRRRRSGPRMSGVGELTSVSEVSAPPLSLDDLEDGLESDSTSVLHTGARSSTAVGLSEDAFAGEADGEFEEEEAEAAVELQATSAPASDSKAAPWAMTSPHLAATSPAPSNAPLRSGLMASAAANDCEARSRSSSTSA